MSDKPIIAGPPRPQQQGGTVGQDLIVRGPLVAPRAPVVPIVAVPVTTPIVRGPTIVPQAGPGWAVFVRHGGPGTPWMKHDLGPLPYQVAFQIASLIVPYSPAVGVGARSGAAPTAYPGGAIV